MFINSFLSLCSAFLAESVMYLLSRMKDVRLLPFYCYEVNYRVRSITAILWLSILNCNSYLFGYLVSHFLIGTTWSVQAFRYLACLVKRISLSLAMQLLRRPRIAQDNTKRYLSNPTTHCDMITTAVITQTLPLPRKNESGVLSFHRSFITCKLVYENPNYQPTQRINI